MKQIIESLVEIQLKLEEIETRFTAWQFAEADLDSLNQAEAALRQYQQQATKLENLILSRRVQLLEKKVETITNQSTTSSSSS